MLPDDLVAPLADVALNTKIQAWIREDLPALSRYDGSVGETVVNTLALMRQDAQTRRNEDVAARGRRRSTCKQQTALPPKITN